MKRTFKILCNFVCMLTLVALVLSSCDLRDFEAIPPNVTTEDNSPAVTTPSETEPSETTTPEITTPEETTPEDTSVTYTVTVVDENNAPLVGAIVQFYIEELCKIPGLTNAYGVATFEYDEPDNYTVRVALAGYTGETSYSFAAGTTALTVQLTKIPEATNPEETTPGTPECVVHGYADRYEKKWGICLNCGYVDDNHEHSIKDGKCEYCDYEFEAIAVPSTFDNDKDGNADVFYFSAALPEEFTGEDVIWLDAYNGSTGDHMTYDEIKTGSGTLPYPHVYCYDQKATDSIVFTLTVEKAGIYNVAVHYRIKSEARTRGAKFIINEGTANEQVINHTYGWNSVEEACAVRNNDFLIGSYMTGLTFALQEGENTITIRVADGVVKNEHFRDLYLVFAEPLPQCETHSYEVDILNNPARFEKTWGICTVCGYIDEYHEHSIKEGKCVHCDYEFEQFEVPSTFDNDGDGNVDVFYFSAALPETFTGEDVIWINAVNDALANDNHMEYDEVQNERIDTPLPYPNVYCHQDSDDELIYTINVEKAGLYNVAIHYRIKDAQTRGATFVVNEGTANEQSIPHTYGWDTTDEAFEVRNNNFLLGSYMTGLVFDLQAGENTITIRVVDGVKKSQLFRDLYLVPVD